MLRYNDLITKLLVYYSCHDLNNQLKVSFSGQDYQYFVHQMFLVFECLVQWGSENRPFENRKHSKTGLFEVWFSNGGTIQKPDNLSSFQMV